MANPTGTCALCPAWKRLEPVEGQQVDTTTGECRYKVPPAYWQPFCAVTSETYWCYEGRQIMSAP